VDEIINSNTENPKPIPTNENTSGMGKEAIVPEELKGWCWAGFLWGWSWGFCNKVKISYLTLAPLPLIDNFLNILFGLRGNELAWKSRKWESIEQFKKEQNNWVTRWLFFNTLILLILISFLIHTKNPKLSLLIGIICVLLIPISLIYQIFKIKNKRTQIFFIIANVVFLIFWIGEIILDVTARTDSMAQGLANYLLFGIYFLIFIFVLYLNKIRNEKIRYRCLNVLSVLMIFATYLMYLMTSG